MNPTDRFPRTHLGQFPTALHRAAPWQIDAAAPVLLKRDDLTGFGLAGNKVRPLEYLMADAVKCDSNVVVTGGAAGSNFIGACAHAAAAVGLDCEIEVAGEPMDVWPVPLLMAQSTGAVIHFTGLDRSLINEQVERRAVELAAEGRGPYPVPRGGATAVGGLGFARAAIELHEQCKARGTDPNQVTVVLPVGSGASIAGFLVGSDFLGAMWKIVGVSVSRNVDQMGGIITDLSAETSELLGREAPSMANFTIIDAVGSHDQGLDENGGLAREQAFRGAGVLLDPTYGVPSYEIISQITRESKDTLVWWLTGGLPGAIESLAVMGNRGSVVAENV